MAEQSKRVRFLRLVTRELERLPRRLALFASLLELADVPEGFCPPVGVLRRGGTRDATLEHRDVLQRRRRIATARPGALDEVEHQARRDVVVTGPKKIPDAVLHDAARANLGVLPEGI